MEHPPELDWILSWRHAAEERRETTKGRILCSGVFMASAQNIVPPKSFLQHSHAPVHAMTGDMRSPDRATRIPTSSEFRCCFLESSTGRWSGRQPRRLSRSSREALAEATCRSDATRVPGFGLALQSRSTGRAGRRRPRPAALRPRSAVADLYASRSIEPRRPLNESQCAVAKACASRSPGARDRPTAFQSTSANEPASRIFDQMALSDELHRE